MGWLVPHMHNLCGFATSQFGDGMQEFVLRKDANGVVRLHLRKSSQGSMWIPEGLGYEAFASNPGPGPPSLASFKQGHQWQRPAVESTHWCNTLFSTLPHDTDPSSLAASMPPPVWRQLPRHAVLQGEPNALLATAASTRLENPA
eukprot:1108891-Pleurochrysis_carterae.AAC.1